MRNLVEKVTAHPAIEVMTQAQILSTGGFVGNFKTAVRFGGLNGDGREAQLDHGAVIIATGATAYEPDEYLCGKKRPGLYPCHPGPGPFGKSVTFKRCQILRFHPVRGKPGAGPALLLPRSAAPTP